MSLLLFWEKDLPLERFKTFAVTQIYWI